MPDLFVSCVQNQVLDVADGPLAPGCQLLVQQLSGPANLGARYIESAELVHDFSDLAGRHPLDVHLCDCKL